MAGVQPSKFINYVSEFKKLLVTRNNGTITQKFKVDSNITDDYYFSIVNNKNQLVNLTGRSFKIYGSLIDAKDDLHILFYSNEADISQNGTEMHFKINTYTSQYMAFIKTNKIIDLTIIEVVQPEQGQESEEDQITQVILRDQAIAYKRPYIDNVQPTEIVYKVLLTANTPLTGSFGSGQDITLTYGSNGAAFGTGLEQTGNNQLVIGMYNEVDNTKVFVIGNGENPSNRSNLFTIDYNGNIATNGALSATAVYINGEEVGTQVDQKLEATSGWVNETFETKDASTSAYNALEQDISDVDSKVDNLSSAMTANYATKVELGAVADAIPSKVSELENDSKYVTSAVVDGYATEQWVLDKQYITSSEIPTDYVTNGQLDEAISSFITIEDVPVYTGASGIGIDSNHVVSITGQVGQIYTADEVTLTLSDQNQFSIKSVREKITAGEGISLSTNTDTGVTTISLFGSGTPGEAVQYYEGTGISIDNYTISINQNWLNAQIPTKVSQLNNDLAFVPSSYLATYATKAEIPTVPTNVGAFTNDVGYLTAHQSLADYYTKTQTDSEIATATDDMATKTWVGQQGYLVQASLADYATENYVDSSISGFAEQDTVESVSSTLADNIALKANSADVYTKTEVDTISTTLSTSIVAQIPSVDGLASEQYVTGAINTASTAIISQIPDTSDLVDNTTLQTVSTAIVEQIPSTEGLATEADLQIVSAAIPTSYLISSDIAEMATTGWVEDQGYLTEHQSLADYYTKSEVDSAISTATSDMATETWVTGQISGKANVADVYTIAEANAAIETATSGKANSSSLTAYALSADVYNKTEVYTKSEADNKFLTGHQSLDNYYTKSEVYSKSEADSKFLSAVPSTYALKSEIPDVSNLATKTEATYTGSGAVVVENNVISLTGELGKTYTGGTDIEVTNENVINFTGTIPSIEGLATEQYVDSAVNTASGNLQTAINGKTTSGEVKDQIEAYGYQTATDVANAISDKVDEDQLTAYYTKTEADNKFLTGHQSLDNYYTKSEVYTKAETDSAIETASGNIENWADSKFLSAHQDISNLATKEELTTVSTTLDAKFADYTTTTDLASTYATKREIPVISTYVAGTNVTITPVEGEDQFTVSATDTTYSAGDGLALENGEFRLTAAVGGNYQAGEGLALNGNTFSLTGTILTGGTNIEVSGKSINFTGTIPTTVAELTDASNYALKTDIPTDYTTSGQASQIASGVVETMSTAIRTGLATTNDISDMATQQWVEDKHYLTAHQDLSDYALKSQIPSVEGLATSAQVSSIIEGYNYATETEVQTVSGQITGWVNDQNYLTAHQSLDDYALKSQIPTDVATSAYVTGCVNDLTTGAVAANTTNIGLVDGRVQAIENDYTTSGQVSSIVEGYGYITGIANNALLSDIKTYTAGTGLTLDGTEFSLTAQIPTSANISGIASAVTTGYLTDYYTKSEANAAFLTATTPIPSKISDLTNDSEFATSAQVSAIVEGYGYITGIENNALLSDIKTYTAGEGLKLEGTEFSLTASIPTGLASWASGTNKDYISGLGFITGVNLDGYATQDWVTLTALADYAKTSAIPTSASELQNDVGYLTSITSSDITTALGFTPVSSDTTYSAGTGLKLTGTEFSLSAAGANENKVLSSHNGVISWETNVAGGGGGTVDVDTICGMLSSADTNTLTISKSSDKIVLSAAAGGGGGTGNIVGGAGIRVIQDGGNTVISIATASLIAAPTAYTFDFRLNNGTTSYDFDYTSYNGNQNLMMSYEGTLPNGVTTTQIASGYQFKATSAANVGNNNSTITAYFDAYDIIKPTSAVVQLTTIGYVSASVTAASAEFTFDGSVASETKTLNYSYNGNQQLSVSFVGLPQGITATNSFNSETGNGTVTFTSDSAEFVSILTANASVVFEANDIALNTSVAVDIILTNVETPITEATPFTIKSNGNTTVTFAKIGSPNEATLSYSVNGSIWNSYTWGTGINLADGSFVSFSGANTAFSNGYSNNCYKLQTSGDGTVEAYGNVDSLVNFTDTLTTRCFQSLFANNEKLVSVKKLLLPASGLAQFCYGNMFGRCTALTTAMRQLPATTMADSCYNNMFQQCSNLSAAPHIMATSGPEAALGNMFNGCTNLNFIEVDFTNWNLVPNSDTYDQDWMGGVQTNAGTFKCPTALGTNENIARGADRCPNNWTVINK